MRQRRWFLVVPAAAVALAACSGKDQPKVDDALSRDLSLAATAQPYPQQQVVSPAEMGYGQAPQQGYAPGYYPQQGYYPAPQPVPVVYRNGYPAPAPAPAPRRTVSRAPSSGTVYSSSAGTVRGEPVRHTKRDALIGVAAGTIAGAAIGKDTKGALIGAAAGGLIGAAVGHTMDVEH
ncbi:MAG TPA: YMGG-like glycine zipper-containing protein [Gemmatimonadaceae bacterium]|nr:YMGG-like glycine zipper-containing protein [Gemmatimonadaceae bacterium]